jgi:hypothetical protein
MSWMLRRVSALAFCMDRERFGGLCSSLRDFLDRYADMTHFRYVKRLWELTWGLLGFLDRYASLPIYIFLTSFQYRASSQLFNRPNSSTDKYVYASFPQTVESIHTE